MTWFVVGFEPRTRQCSGGCSKTVVTSVSASSMASGVSTFLGAELATEGSTELPELFSRPLALGAEADPVEWADEAELVLLAAVMKIVNTI